MARYVELVVQADERDLKAFLTGCLAAAGPPRIVYADEAGFQLHRLRERIRHHGEVQHLVVEEEHAGAVRKALEASGPRYDFNIKDERVVQTGIFSFEFDTPSRDVAGKLKQLVAGLPPGAVLEHYEPREGSSAADVGTEIYAPTHDYRFEGKGAIRGDLFAVVDARAAIAAIDFTRCDEIEIENGQS